MIIGRKKALNTIFIIIASFALLMFFVVSVIGLFSDRSGIEKVALLFFLAISLLGLRSVCFSLVKIFSMKPEFELAKNDFLIFDNHSYDKIPYANIVDCKLYYPPEHSGMIGIFLKPESKIEGNSNMIKDILYKLPKEAKVVLLSLEFADINHDHLIQALKNKIDNARIKETE